MAQLSTEEHEHLMLRVLEDAGVDNWTGYGVASAVYDYEEYLADVKDDSKALSFDEWMDKNGKSLDDWF